MEAIEIKGLDGEVRRRFDKDRVTGKLPSWNDIFRILAEDHKRDLAGMDFSSAIREQVSLNRVNFHNCLLDFEKMERSSLIECHFEEVTFFQSSFHHLADRSDRERPMGTLFRKCTFRNTVFREVDFVMSKFHDCEFDGCRIQKCDMRNVYWFDRYRCNAQRWVDIPKLPDPFRTSTISETRFGHPVANIMNVPVQMMIPASYESVWAAMGVLQRKMTRASYMMREESSEMFHSAI
jgi:uncharacterized protein YjbI with pentapeptide repeats